MSWFEALVPASWFGGGTDAGATRIPDDAAARDTPIHTTKGAASDEHSWHNLFGASSKKAAFKHGESRLVSSHQEQPTGGGSSSNDGDSAITKSPGSPASQRSKGRAASTRRVRVVTPSSRAARPTGHGESPGEGGSRSPKKTLSLIHI